ncbi:MAG: xanthine dehydrogenase family protein molybdopterin-binding subunit, partial [Thermomicrobiales bacterium]
MKPTTPLNAATRRARATSSVRYTADLVPKGTVIAGLARSPHPHAKVVRIDARRALSVPGVLAVLVPDDFDGIRLGHLIADEPVLTTVARYVGDAIAAVAAIDGDSLARGIEALEVEYQLLPYALSTEDAVELTTPIHDSCPDNVATRFAAQRGDWSAAVARVAIWAEGTFQTEAAQHAYLEPRACFARYTAERLELVAGSHAPSVLADDYRRIVETWGRTLEVITPDIGGSFGAKWEHPIHLVCLAFAHRLECDVAMVFARTEDMIAGRTRLAMRIRVRLGAAANGELVAKETELVADNGAYSLHGPAVLAAAAIRADNLYRFTATKSDARLVYTNNMPSECFRGFGMPQAVFAQEQLVDELARRLGFEPVEFRRINANRAGDTSIHGWRIGSCGFEQCLAAVEEKLAEHRRLQPKPSDDRYRVGYGIAGFIHCVSNRGYNKNFEGANIDLGFDSDGSIRISSAEVELGCGTVEVLTILVARELGLDPGRLQVVLGNTSTGPFGLGSFASRTAFFIGLAALDACRKFKDACKVLASELDMSADSAVAEVMVSAAKAGRWRDLCVSGAYEPVGVEVPDNSGYGNISPAYTFGVQGCCVNIDTWTGKITVDRIWAAHDAGTVLNPV